MLEKKHQRVLPVRQFTWRLAKFGAIAFVLVLIALGIGIAGYHLIAGLNLVDSFLNAAMLLGGMGPVNQLETDRAKIFAALYALFSGLVFISVETIGDSHSFFHLC